MENNEEITTLSEMLDKVEQSTCGEEVKLWLDEICSEDFGLISFLIEAVAFQSSTPAVYSKILRQLLDYSFFTVYEKLQKKQSFFEELSNYISESELAQLSPDIVHIYLRVHLEDKSKFEVTQKIFIKILDFIEKIRDELYFMKFIQEWLPKYSEEFMENENAKLVLERLFLYLNRSEGKERVSYLSIIHQIAKLNIDYFYTNDLKSLCDIILQIFDNQEGLAYQVCLQVLTVLFEAQDFFGLKYRIDEIKEAVIALEDSEDYIKYKVDLLSKLNDIE